MLEQAANDESAGLMGVLLGLLIGVLLLLAAVHFAVPWGTVESCDSSGESGCDKLLALNTAGLSVSGIAAVVAGAASIVSKRVGVVIALVGLLISLVLLLASLT